jgi:hypothetical protein
MSGSPSQRQGKSVKKYLTFEFKGYRPYRQRLFPRLIFRFASGRGSGRFRRPCPPQAMYHLKQREL